MDAYERAAVELRNATYDFKNLVARDKRAEYYSMSGYMGEMLAQMSPLEAALLAYRAGFMKGTRYQKRKDKERDNRTTNSRRNCNASNIQKDESTN